MTRTGIYKWTSIGRPLDPGYPTNKAVLALMPVSGLVAAAFRGFESGPNASLLVTFVSGAVAAVGGWALTRELLPDDPLAAFGSLGGSVVAVILVPEASLLFLFAAVLLARMVIRTVGLPVRLGDSMAVSVLVAWAVYDSGILAAGFACSAAFVLDAALPARHPRQWIFGLLWLVISTILLSTGTMPLFATGWEPEVMFWILIGVASLFLLRMIQTRPPAARADATGEPLSLSRVRAGMAVALFMGVATLFLETSALRQAALVWASLAGAGIAGIRATRASSGRIGEGRHR